MEHAIPRRVDVLVIGAGPAGSTTAVKLARKGWRVAVLGRPRPGAPGIGETLPPVSRSTLRELGVWSRFIADGHRAGGGTVSWWDTDRALEHDFVLQPFGTPWHVDRVRFDRMLALAATEAGADLIEDARLIRADLISGPAGAERWHLQLVANGLLHRLSARFIVQATGRATPVRLAGARRWRLDRLIAVGTVLRARRESTDIDVRTWIEAAPTGWWYSAPGVDGRWTVLFFTDADLFGAHTSRGFVGVWARRLMRAPNTAGRLTSLGFGPDSLSRGVVASSLRIVAADSYVTLPCYGTRWLTAGDASSAWDPLSGQGIERALRSGIRAAHAVDACLSDDSGSAPSSLAGGSVAALMEYGVAQGVLDHQYRWQRRACYARVQRWPDLEFWRRRSGVDDEAGRWRDRAESDLVPAGNPEVAGTGSTG